jgi:hypothetical protein
MTYTLCTGLKLCENGFGVWTCIFAQDYSGLLHKVLQKKKMTASDWLAIMIGHHAGSSIFRIVFNLLLSSFACFYGWGCQGKQLTLYDGCETERGAMAGPAHSKINIYTYIYIHIHCRIKSGIWVLKKTDTFLCKWHVIGGR